LHWIKACMKVKILKAETNEFVSAYIKESANIRLPSVSGGWRFNFHKHAKTKGSNTYILITEKTPGIIEGCMIYKMIDDKDPYMAYIEVAPHNRGKEKEYDLVAGCLIAYAARLSFILGQDYYKGWLAFDVREEKEDDQKKLMALYSKKYGARLFDKTTMYILPEDGEKLIEKYLNK
jgi:hypothetical protein